jgi:transposase
VISNVQNTTCQKEVIMESDISRIEAFRQFKKEIRGVDTHLIVGIDIAKSKHHAFFGTPNGKTVLKGLIVENSASGFEHLLTQTQFYMDRDGFKQVVFGVEPTGVYHKPLAEFLIEQDHLVVYVTNEAIKNNRSLLDNRWDKNDTKDSANVADLIAQGKCHYYDFPDHGLRDIRSLLLFRKRLKRQLHSCRVRIRNNLVAQYFPEMDKHWNQAESENLAIVRWCLSPEKINDMSFQDFYQMVTTRNRGLRQHRRILKIWETAPYSIGCRTSAASQLEARLMADNVNYFKRQIKEVEDTVFDICQSYEPYELLKTIPGFGPYVSAVVLSAIGNPHRFDNVSQVIKLAGFDLNAHRSGKKSATAVPVISKKGKADLRYALYQAAIIASSLTAHFRAYYHRLLEGRQKEKGIRTKMRVKLAAKLLVIAWTLMKKKEPFNPEFVKI